MQTPLHEYLQDGVRILYEYDAGFTTSLVIDNLGEFLILHVVYMIIYKVIHWVSSCTSSFRETIQIKYQLPLSKISQDSKLSIPLLQITIFYYLFVLQVKGAQSALYARRW